jgi:hypothetical protein
MLDSLDETPAAPSAGIGFLSLHTAYSTTRTNEVTGGSPAYAAQACVFAAASSGTKAMTGTETFDVPAGTTVAWVGFCSASTAGTFFGMVPAGGGALKPFTMDNTTDDTLESIGHGFANTNTVVVWAGSNTLPTGISEGTIYFVVASATDTLQLSATSGGAAINLTGKGAGFLQAITPETFGSQGTYQVSALTLDAGAA